VGRSGENDLDSHQNASWEKGYVRRRKYCWVEKGGDWLTSAEIFGGRKWKRSRLGPMESYRNNHNRDLWVKQKKKGTGRSAVEEKSTRWELGKGGGGGGAYALTNIKRLQKTNGA